jgi:hypothetical protein
MLHNAWDVNQIVSTVLPLPVSNVMIHTKLALIPVFVLQDSTSIIILVQLALPTALTVPMSQVAPLATLLIFLMILPFYVSNVRSTVSTATLQLV